MLIGLKVAIPKWFSLSCRLSVIWKTSTNCIVLNKFEADKNLPQIYRELIPEWRKLGQMTMYYACFIFVIGIILLTSKVFAD